MIKKALRSSSFPRHIQDNPFRTPQKNQLQGSGTPLLLLYYTEKRKVVVPLGLVAFPSLSSLFPWLPLSLHFFKSPVTSLPAVFVGHTAGEQQRKDGDKYQGLPPFVHLMPWPPAPLLLPGTQK